MKALDMFIAAAEKFIDKCDRGQARSVTTYAELKAALKQAQIEAADNMSIERQG